MNPMPVRRVFLVSLILAGALALPSCDDGPAGPRLPSPTLENVWPAEDGRSWTYAGEARTWDGRLVDPERNYSDPDSVPPAPSIDGILPWVDDPSVPEPHMSTAETWRLRFDGLATTVSGVTGQNLVEEQAVAPAGEGSVPAGFLTRLAAVRPDLRAALVRAGWREPLRAAEEFEPVPFGLLFLHGGVWERTESWIGAYGDLDTLLAWKYLEADLSKGHRFVHQLVPSLADDVFLHALVRSRGSLRTPVGEFQNVLEVVYLVDFGVSDNAGSPGPEPTVYFRPISFGNVLYAPTVGPVASYERDLVLVGETLGPGVGDRTIVLSGVRAGPTP